MSVESDLFRISVIGPKANVTRMLNEAIRQEGAGEIIVESDDIETVNRKLIGKDGMPGLMVVYGQLIDEKCLEEDALINEKWQAAVDRHKQKVASGEPMDDEYESRVELFKVKEYDSGSYEVQFSEYVSECAMDFDCIDWVDWEDIARVYKCRVFVDDLYYRNGEFMRFECATIYEPAEGSVRRTRLESGTTREEYDEFMDKLVELCPERYSPILEKYLQGRSIMEKKLNYDSADDFCEGMACVRRDGKCGFIDTSGREVVPCIYDGVDAFHEGMARVNIGGGWHSIGDEEPILSGGKTGFVDKTGREVIPCQYLYADNFHDGLAWVEVREDGKSSCFFIDKSGRRAGPSIDHSSDVFSEGLAKTYHDGKCGFMDKTGSVVIPCMYDDAGVFHEGLARVECNQKWGFVDNTGREVIPCQYEFVKDFHEGMAQVWVGGKRNYDEECGCDVLSGCKIGYIDKSGREVIPCQYEYANDFHDGLACVNVGLKEYGFIDKAGRVVIRDVSPAEFSEGLAYVRYGKKTGYIDKTGQVLIPDRFDQAYGFHDGLAMVREDRTWGFIDKTGQMVIEYHTDPAPPSAQFSASDNELPF